MRIYLFTGPNSIRTTTLACRYYAEYRPQDEILIVTPNPGVLERQINSDITTKIIPDSSIDGYEKVREFLRENERHILTKNRRIGWYLQQYLKLSLAWNCDDPIFISDGDTIFSHSLLSALDVNPFIMATKENVDIYRLGNKVMGVPLSGISYIANGGFFLGKTLRDLHSSPSDWFMNSIRSILNTQDSSDLSEYQIQGSLLKDTLETKQIHIYRRFDLLCDLSQMDDNGLYTKVEDALAKYDAIAFEANHSRSITKSILAKIAYQIGYSW